MSDVADPGLALTGQPGIAWAERAMPVLGMLRAAFASQQPFDGLTIACCLHVTAETAVLIRTLTEEQANYIGVPIEGPYKPDHYRY